MPLTFQAQLANEDALLQQQLHEQRQQHLQGLQAEHSHKEQKGNQQVRRCLPTMHCLALGCCHILAAYVLVAQCIELKWCWDADSIPSANRPGQYRSAVALHFDLLALAPHPRGGGGGAVEFQIPSSCHKHAHFVLISWSSCLLLQSCVLNAWFLQA